MLLFHTFLTCPIFVDFLFPFSKQDISTWWRKQLTHEPSFCRQGVLERRMIATETIFGKGSFAEKYAQFFHGSEGNAFLSPNVIRWMMWFISKWRDSEDYSVQPLHFKNEKTEALRGEVTCLKVTWSASGRAGKETEPSEGMIFSIYICGSIHHVPLPPTMVMIIKGQSKRMNRTIQTVSPMSILEFGHCQGGSQKADLDLSLIDSWFNQIPSSCL